jgi:CheY-like chemotaxis protein
MSTVLLVEADAAARDRMGAWLEAEGHEALVCPGPQAPSYRCVGSSAGTCTLAGGADVVVLDLELAGSAAGVGASGSDLASLYRSLGRPVITVGEAGTARAGGVALRWPPSRGEFVSALRLALTPPHA